MSDSSPTLVLAGLSPSDQADLLDQLPDGSAERRKEGLTEGELGEPATAILLIALSVHTLTAICGWVSSKGKDVEVTVGPSGATVRITRADTPADLQARLAEQGISVPAD
jgi:hypothetical protein